MKYIDTTMFASLLAPMDAEIVALQRQRDQLARTIEERKLTNVELKRSKQRPTVALENSLVAKSRQLDELEKKKRRHHDDLSVFTWTEVLTMLVELEGHSWNAKQLELGNKECEDYEGRYEESFRDWMGWEPGASLGAVDFPDNTEGKYLNGSEVTFRAGSSGKKAFGSLLKQLPRVFADNVMDESLWDVIYTGEVSVGKVYSSLPEEVRALFQDLLSVDKVLGHYAAMVFFTDVGFFVVPKKDYGEALQLANVSQMSPKYRLKRDYVERRLLNPLVLHDKPDVAA